MTAISIRETGGEDARSRYMSDGIGGILTLVVTVFVLGILDIDVFWPILEATAGGWAAPMMGVLLIVEGVGVMAELKALA
jgi:hypothetical protein